MSSRTSNQPSAAFCEDVDERGKTLPETRVSANANVAVKRSSKPELDAAQMPEESIAGDSGYSSRAATVASANSDQKDGTAKVRRVSLRLDTTMHPSDGQDRHGSRPQHVRQGSSSHTTSSHRKPTMRRESSQRHEPGTCRDCDESFVDENLERLSKRFSRDARLASVQESLPTMTILPAQVQSVRPRPHRRSSSTRPASADYTSLATSIQYERERGPPPSAWGNLPSPVAYAHPPPSPQYILPPTPTYVSPVPYNPSPVAIYTQPRIAPQPLQRRSTIYGPPLVRQDSYGSVTYSAAPIRDNRIPEYQYSAHSGDSYIRQQHDEEARRQMPPPPRPTVGRSAATTTAVHHVEGATPRPRDHHSRRPSDLEPVSTTTIRPPNRKSVSYDVDTKRHSVDYSLTRRPTLDGHEVGRDLEEKVHYAEDYQRHTDINPRVSLTREAVKKARVPSNAGSHKSRSSKGSGHKSGSSSHKAGSMTILKDGMKLDINDTKHRPYTITPSDNGVSITVREKGTRATSKRSNDVSTRDDRRSRRTSRDLDVPERGRFISRSRYSIWGRRDSSS